ncbi:DUF3592 domain-containing protein [Desulfolithobacter sp.]
MTKERYFSGRFVLRAGLLMSGSLAAVAGGLLMLRASEPPSGWLSVPGTVIGREITLETRYVDHENLTETCYRGIVRYSYDVPSGRWVNDDLYLDGSPCIEGNHGREMAEKLIEPYEAGSRVRVFYNSEYPGQSYLVSPGSREGWTLVVVGALGLLILSGWAALRRAFGTGIPDIVSPGLDLRTRDNE